MRIQLNSCDKSGIIMQFYFECGFVHKKILISSNYFSQKCWQLHCNTFLKHVFVFCLHENQSQAIKFNVMLVSASVVLRQFSLLFLRLCCCLWSCRVSNIRHGWEKKRLLYFWLQKGSINIFSLAVFFDYWITQIFVTQRICRKVHYVRLSRTLFFSEKKFKCWKVNSHYEKIN